MKKSVIALVLALMLAVSLTACMGPDNSKDGTAGSGSVTSGQVSRRYTGTYDSRSYLGDGRYTAGSTGRVYDRDGSYAGRDLTRDARDLVRDAGDAIGDVGRSIGDVGRSVGDVITGNDSFNGTPSWEPDSSAVRY